MMEQNKGQRIPRRWAAYETGKDGIAQRVTRSGKDGKDAAKLYEREIKQLATRLRV